MEEQKIDKRSKAYKESVTTTLTATNLKEKSHLERLIENGIPLVKSEFQSAVNNGDKVPENYFATASDNKNRRVDMWLCAGGTIVVCRHKDKYFFTPTANVKFGNFN